MLTLLNESCINHSQFFGINFILSTLFSVYRNKLIIKAFLFFSGLFLQSKFYIIICIIIIWLTIFFSVTFVSNVLFKDKYWDFGVLTGGFSWTSKLAKLWKRRGNEAFSLRPNTSKLDDDQLSLMVLLKNIFAKNPISSTQNLSARNILCIKYYTSLE